MRISDWSSDVCSSDLCKVLSKTSRPVLLIFLPSSDQCRLLAQSMPQSGGRQLIAVNPRCLTSVNKIGRASCRERVCQYVEISVVAVTLKKKKSKKKTRRYKEVKSATRRPSEKQ